VVGDDRRALAAVELDRAPAVDAEALARRLDAGELEPQPHPPAARRRFEEADLAAAVIDAANGRASRFPTTNTIKAPRGPFPERRTGFKRMSKFPEGTEDAGEERKAMRLRAKSTSSP
jgi:hypothetical protein